MMIETIDSDPPFDGILCDSDVGHPSWQHLPEHLPHHLHVITLTLYLPVIMMVGIVVHITPVLHVTIAVLELHLDWNKQNMTWFWYIVPFRKNPPRSCSYYQLEEWLDMIWTGGLWSTGSGLAPVVRDREPATCHRRHRSQRQPHILCQCGKAGNGPLALGYRKIELDRHYFWPCLSIICVYVNNLSLEKFPGIMWYVTFLGYIIFILTVLWWKLKCFILAYSGTH